MELNKETVLRTGNKNHINQQCSIQQKLVQTTNVWWSFQTKLFSSWGLTWCLHCDHRGRGVEKPHSKVTLTWPENSSAPLKCHACPSPRDHVTPEHKTQCLLGLDGWGSKGFNLGFLTLQFWPLFHFAQLCHRPTSWYFSKAAQRDLETNLIWGAALYIPILCERFPARGVRCFGLKIVPYALVSSW